MAKPRPELADYYADVFAPLGAISVDRLFGGWRYRLDGQAFAFVVGDGLYFRVGDGLRAELESRGSQPFTYAKRNGRVTITRFVSAPEADLEDEDALRVWAIRVLAEPEPAGG
jgi:DNA transformation protein